MWKQHKCSTIDGWINKMWSINTMEQYFNHQRGLNTNLCYNMMNLENKNSNSQKATYHIIAFMWNVIISNKQTWKIMVSREWRRGGTWKGEWWLRAEEFLLSDENVLKLTVIMVAQICKYAKNHWIYILSEWIVWYVDYASINLFLFLKKGRKEKKRTRFLGKVQVTHYTVVSR